MSLRKERKKTGPYSDLPRDLRIKIFSRVEENKKQSVNFSYGLSLHCPYGGKEHHALHIYSAFFGMEQYWCDVCGYHYCMMIVNGEKKMISANDREPEQTICSTYLYHEMIPRLPKRKRRKR